MTRTLDLIKLVTQDAHSLASRYPQQLLFALIDERVRQAIEKRFASGQVLKGVDTLPAHRATGLIPIHLSFAAGSALNLDTGSLLVELNHRCEVVGIDEEFEARLPNPVTKLPPRDPLPMAVVKSEDGRLTRQIPPDVLEQMSDLHDALIVKHGILVQAHETGGGSVGVILDTESEVPVPYTYDSIVRVLGENGEEVDRFTVADYGSRDETMVDDSQSTTLDSLFELLR